MSTYVIGDVQGCWRTLEALLRRIDFDPSRDRAWLAGDLVNRGPSSLPVLRWARSLGDRCVAVLGNHDIKLLAQAASVAKAGRLDTLDDVLQAPDRDELLDWLRRRPLLHREGGWLLVHAGLMPSWTEEDAVALAGEVESVLRRGALHDAMVRLLERAPVRWDDALKGERRLAAILASCVRLRTCHADGAVCWDFSGSPDDAPTGCRPWFDVRRRPLQDRVLFGHWSALGLVVREDIVALDTGCVWGRELSAIRLEDGVVFQEPSLDMPRREDA